MEKYRRKEFKKCKKELLKMWKKQKKSYIKELKFIEEIQKTTTSDLKYLNERDIQDRLKLLKGSERLILQLAKDIIDWNSGVYEMWDNLVSVYFKDDLPEPDIIKQIAEINAEIYVFSEYVNQMLRIRQKHNDSCIAIFEI